MIRGFNQIGSVIVGPDTISVRIKESKDLGTGEIVYGLSIQIDGQPVATRTGLD
ncbi:MAG: hypothetical protein WDN00_08225 [Limisphaerales bacterium]